MNQNFVFYRTDLLLNETEIYSTNAPHILLFYSTESLQVYDLESMSFSLKKEFQKHTSF